MIASASTIIRSIKFLAGRNVGDRPGDHAPAPGGRSGRLQPTRRPHAALGDWMFYFEQFGYAGSHRFRSFLLAAAAVEGAPNWPRREKGGGDPNLRGIVVSDKGANLLAKSIVVQREPQIPVTTSRPTVVARLQTPKSTDAGGAAANRFPRCGPDRPCCRRTLFLPAFGTGGRLPAS